ncbi:MAG: aminotransferase class V-fold PLP-dependent enzyme, partial [Planctomycetota bacterium]|nr:aminotransferase class V-fold PLP-dependent enzyme [Planctomycetota bacterium]
LFGLDAALEWIETQSVETLASRERDMHLKMAKCIEATPGLHRLGPKAPTLGTFALQHDEYDAATFAAILDSQFHLHLRAGLHCAPRIHRQLNSDTAGGAVRLSLGATTPLDAVDRLAEALEAISKQELV